MRKLILASTSTIHGSGYLTYLLTELSDFFKHTDTILFIPFARPSGLTYDQYTNMVQEAFLQIDKKIIGLHNFKDKQHAITFAQAIFTGGGNTFELLNQLYKHELLNVLKDVVDNGTPYLGTSAGSNICGLDIKTTNDMPIVYPPSFDALQLVPFNINPHYLDPDPNSKHMGETRQTRIQEFHQYNSQPVIGLREGSWLEVTGNTTTLKGNQTARLFKQNQEPLEIITNSLINNFI